MSEIILRQLPGTNQPKMSFKPMGDFTLVTISFQSKIKNLISLNQTNYNIDITTYRRGGEMQNIIQVKVDIKVPTMLLMKQLDLRFPKRRQGNNHLP